jgi:hypothetical protein
LTLFYSIFRLNVDSFSLDSAICDRGFEHETFNTEPYSDSVSESFATLTAVDDRIVMTNFDSNVCETQMFVLGFRF